jgi:MFS transporter, OFA family, oxalate/formate antiporter
MFKNITFKKASLFAPQKWRWFLLSICFIINVFVGSGYSWSVFVNPLFMFFTQNLSQNITVNDVLMPFSAYIVVFALTMAIIPGKSIDVLGVRGTAIAGCVLLGLGWFLSSMVTTPSLLVFTYGVIGGIGSGIAFGITLTVVNRWFPDQQGFAIGIAVFGNGISALFFANLVGYFINTFGIINMFQFFGIAIILITVPLASFLAFPPVGWTPKSESHTIPATIESEKIKCTRLDMMKTPIFYCLWVCFFIVSTIGLMIVAISQPFGTETINIDAVFATSLVSLFALSNGVGRPIFGYLSDKFSPRNIMMISFLLMAIASLIIIQKPIFPIYWLSFMIFWFCLGGWMAIAPAATSHYFGTYDYTRCYGVLMLAYGIGGLSGPLLAGYIRTSTGSYMGVFFPIFILAITGFLIAFLLMKQKFKTI